MTYLKITVAESVLISSSTLLVDLVTLSIKELD